jgi:hypothetical protein
LLHPTGRLLLLLWLLLLLHLTLLVLHLLRLDLLLLLRLAAHHSARSVHHRLPHHGTGCHRLRRAVPLLHPALLLLLLLLSAVARPLAHRGQHPALLCHAHAGRVHRTARLPRVRRHLRLARAHHPGAHRRAAHHAHGPARTGLPAAVVHPLQLRLLLHLEEYGGKEQLFRALI